MKIYSYTMALLYALAGTGSILAAGGIISFFPPSIPLAFSFMVISAVYARPDMPHIIVGTILSVSISTIYILGAGARLMNEFLNEGNASLNIEEINGMAIALSILSIAGMWYYKTREVKNG